MEDILRYLESKSVRLPELPSRDEPWGRVINSNDDRNEPYERDPPAYSRT